MNFFGWKDVLRPIRDGYRKLLPSPDTGPTPEERERQRALDQLKGFTYFDTFDQLESWKSGNIDPTRRSNTPLLKRPPVVEEAGEKANVLLCHDYSGNYHDYESAQGAGIDDESYACEYLQFVDTFVYFSHKLACVPPPSWTNCLHRNGVKVLGTFLVEPQTRDTERILKFNEEVDGIVIFPIAQKLAGIAKHYGFDGWLVNIEKPFVRESWDPLVLEEFLRQLRDGLGTDRQLIWYDSLSTSNKISYQNALTSLNLPFTKACGNILTNYCWKETDVLSSKQLAVSNSLPPNFTYFGVDVWAQNTTTLIHPRTTYGGGGTNTGFAVAKLASIGLSVGVFAPAWGFEHFPKHGREIEKVIWDGGHIPEDLECSCGNVSMQHPPNPRNPIIRSAREFPAGSSSFFYTDFSRAFGRQEHEQNHLWSGKTIHSQVASQSLLPHMSKTSHSRNDIGSTINTLSMRLDDLHGSTQLVVEARSLLLADDAPGENPDNPKLYERYLPLFNLNISTTAPLRLSISYTFLLDYPTPLMSPAFYIKSSGGPSDTRLFRINHPGRSTIEANHTLVGERINEIGFYLTAPVFSKDLVKVVNITEICITPLNSTSVEYTIDNIRIKGGGEGETRHKRLYWSYSGEEENKIMDGVPYSESTGPFSYFRLQVDGIDLGRAYAMEYVLSEALVKRSDGKNVEVKITGIGFEGRKITESWARMLI